MIPRMRFAAAALVALLIAQQLPAAPSAEPFHRTGPFLLGADVSWVQEDEANGSTYYDHGKKEDPFQILKDHGFNAIRLRVFVDPASEKGYAHTSKEAYCDLAHTLAMARRAHDAGMALLIDLHYSDTWADPGKQAKPVAWEKLDFAGLNKAVYDHTHEVLAALVAQGTKPLMVQIGNEVSNGMLWPDGNTKEDFDQFAEFLKSGIKAARDVDPSIKIVIHTDKGSNVALARRWIEGLVSRGVQPDIIGLSCNGTNPPAKWKETFDDLSTRFPQFGLIASEYGYHKRELNDIVFNTPEQRGIGTFIWEPTRHHESLFDQDGHNAGQGTQKRPTSGEAPFVVTTGHHPRTGRFDTNALIDLYPQMAKDYGDSR